MKKAYEIFRSELDSIKEAGTYKDERIITTPQKARIDTTVAKGVLNMCANNYLGLSNNPEVIAAAKASYDEWGFGLSSVRFICGTQLIHKQLERKIADFLGMDDCILYTSCFDANGGLFETLLGAEDAIISDELNHASIIDGVRLCKAKRFRYKNNNMEDLKAQLEAAKDCRIKVIATDGVFSMDGFIANLPAICDLADEYGALVMVLMTAMLSASWANTARALTNIAVLWVVLTSSPAPSAKHSAAQAAVTRQLVRRLLTCFVRSPVRICSPTRFHPQFVQHPSRYSIC